MLDECFAEVLCMFTKPYGSYMESVCDRGDEVANLLEIAGTEFPDHFSDTRKCSTKDLRDAQEFLIKETQGKFFARKGERHETNVPKWILENEGAIEEAAPFLLKAFTAPKKPEITNPGCIAVLGASRKEFSKRLSSLSFFDNPEENPIYLLAGTRKLWDGEITIGERAGWSKKHPGQEITESLMMKEVFEREYPGYAFKLISTEPCNAKPGCSRNRANTEDTVEAFLDSNQNCSSISFISRAPNIAPQYEAVRPVMEARAQDVKFEVVGAGASIYEIKADSPRQYFIYHILMPFGGALWGGFERVYTEILEKNEQCPMHYEYLKALKYKMKDNLTEAEKSSKKLVTPL